MAHDFIIKIRNRMLKQNKNWLAIICGETGSGKSYSALQLANIISPRGITIKRNVVFNPLELLELINNPKRLKKGDVVIFDEAGVGMSSREWYSVQNKLLGSVLQTFRNLNVGVIFTTPNLSFIDVQARKLFHNYMETATINYKDKIAYLKVYNIQHNSRIDKTYYKYPKVKDENGRVTTFKHIAVAKPPIKIIKDYEEVKTAYTKKLNEEALDELKNQLIKPEKKEIDYNQIAKEVKNNIKSYTKVRAGKEYIDIMKIAGDYDLGKNTSYKIRAKVERLLK